MLPSELNFVYRHEFGMDENENSASWYQHYWRTFVGEDDDQARGIDSSDDGGWLERRQELLSVWDMAEYDFDPQAEMNPAVILSFDYRFPQTYSCKKEDTFIDFDCTIYTTYYIDFDGTIYKTY